MKNDEDTPKVQSLTRRGVIAAGAAAGVATLSKVPGLGGPSVAGATAVAVGDGSTWQPKFLSSQQVELMSRICDLILPATETPGALDTGADEYIDLSLSLADSADQLRFLGGLSWMEERSAELHEKRFVELAQDQQIALLREISDEHPLHSAELVTGAAFFTDIKRRVLFGHFTSKKARVEALGLPAEVRRESLRGCTHEDGTHRR